MIQTSTESPRLHGIGSSIHPLIRRRYTLAQRSRRKGDTMLWAEIRQAYPNQWLIIEALEAHTTPDKQRHLDCLAVIDTCPDGSAALQCYRHWHQQYPP